MDQNMAAKKILIATLSCPWKFPNQPPNSCHFVGPGRRVKSTVNHIPDKSCYWTRKEKMSDAFIRCTKHTLF